MRKILIVMLLMLVSTASAEKGIVLNTDNTVAYKFDLPPGNGSLNVPILEQGQYMILKETSGEINAVLKGAVYDPATMTFKNPVVLPVVAYEEVEIQAKPSAVDPNVLILSGAGITSAYLIARRKKT